MVSQVCRWNVSPSSLMPSNDLDSGTEDLELARCGASQQVKSPRPQTFSYNRVPSGILDSIPMCYFRYYINNWYYKSIYPIFRKTFGSAYGGSFFAKVSRNLFMCCHYRNKLMFYHPKTRRFDASQIC